MISRTLPQKNVNYTSQSSEAYQDSDVLDKVAPIQVATYAIFWEILQRAEKRNAIFVMVSSHVKKEFNWKSTVIHNLLKWVPILNPLSLILPSCSPVLVFRIYKRKQAPKTMIQLVHNNSISVHHVFPK